MNEIRSAFLQANDAVFFNEKTGQYDGIEVEDQRKIWKEMHKATIGGDYFSPNYSPSIINEPLYIEFENEGDYILFMLKWS